MSPEITEALAVAAELHSQGIMIVIVDNELFLHDRYYPSAELEHRWEAAKPTIKALMGWAIPVFIEKGHWLDDEKENWQHPYANADFEAVYPRFFQPRN